MCVCSFSLFDKSLLSGAATMLLMLLFLIFYSPLACYLYRFVASSFFSCCPIILYVIYAYYSCVDGTEIKDTLTTSSSKTNPIPITLSHLLLTSTTFSQSSSLTNIPTPPVLSSFPHYHSLYLLPLTPIKRAPSPFHLTSCKQHTSTFRFLNSSHTSVPLPDILPTFQLPNLTPSRFSTFSLEL